MNSSPSAPSWFVQRVRLTETLTKQIGIVLVVNVRGRTEILEDYAEDSIVADFLHDEELDDLIAGFEQAGIYCEVVQDEEGFQRWLTTGRSAFPRSQPLVLNLSQNGTGPARLSLVPGLCRLNRLPLVDSDVYAVAISRHKFHYSVILRGAGLPAARSWWFTKRGWWPSPPPHGVILIYKPTYESASIGVHEDSVFEMNSNADARLSVGLNNMVDFFRLYSHGNLDLSGTQVFGWFVLPQKKSQYTGSGANPAGRADLVNWCIAAATAGRVDVNQFYGVVCCLNNPTDLFANIGTPGRVVCDPNNLQLAPVAQEMLHGYGINHARLDGSTVDYQDPYDVMSVHTTPFSARNEANFPACSSLSANRLMGPGMNAALMDSGGWLDPSRVWTYSGKAGSFELRPHHRRDLPGFLVARVGPYYVEFRMNEDFDAGIPFPAVLLHRFDQDAHSYLMRATNGADNLVAGSTFTWKTNATAVIVTVTAIDTVNRVATLSVTGIDVAVPDLVGDSLAQARQNAQNLGFVLHTSGKGNVVADQEPAAGTEVPPRSAIYVTLTYEGKG